MIPLLVIVLSATGPGRGSPSEEVGFLDLATAERSDDELQLTVVSGSRATGVNLSSASPAVNH
jgi:hypothetical protein